MVLYRDLHQWRNPCILVYWGVKNVRNSILKVSKLTLYVLRMFVGYVIILYTQSEYYKRFLFDLYKTTDMVINEPREYYSSCEPVMYMLEIWEHQLLNNLAKRWIYTRTIWSSENYFTRDIWLLPGKRNLVSISLPSLNFLINYTIHKT